METKIIEDVFNSILDGDRNRAVRLVDEWAVANSYHNASIKILDPVLAKIGQMWATTEDLSIAQGYIAAKITEIIMGKAAEEKTGTNRRNESKGPVVIGNILDDCHALGRKLVTTFLERSNWEVIDLGNDVDPSEFVDRAVEVNAPVIGASAMMYTTAINIRRLRDEIDHRGLKQKIKLAVGGAVFIQRPELVEMVGGDGTARNAIDAPALMDRLIPT